MQCLPLVVWPAVCRRVLVAVWCSNFAHTVVAVHTHLVHVYCTSLGQLEIPRKSPGLQKYRQKKLCRNYQRDVRPQLHGQ